MQERYDLQITFMDNQVIIVPGIHKHDVYDGVLKCFVITEIYYRTERKCIQEFPISNIRYYKRTK